MSLCGYNEKIGKGLEFFIEGMADSLNEKTLLRSKEQVLEQELIELENMIDVLKTATHNTSAEMFVGLNMLAQAMFLNVRDKIGKDNNRDLVKTCVEVGKDFINLLARTEEKNKQVPLAEWNNMAIADKARSLAGWAVDNSN